jgi:hypothetical protein
MSTADRSVPSFSSAILPRLSLWLAGLHSRVLRAAAIVLGGALVLLAARHARWLLLVLSIGGPNGVRLWQPTASLAGSRRASPGALQRTARVQSSALKALKRTRPCAGCWCERCCCLWWLARCSARHAKRSSLFVPTFSFQPAFGRLLFRTTRSG